LDAISETSDLIPAGQQIAKQLLLKLKMNSETNRQTRSHQSTRQKTKIVEPEKEAIQFDDF
jgi:hypothetical protein